MRLEQISYFLQVAETQSMTGAAKELYISQPALSKQIALLEREVGVPLFERKARGVVLTSAGRQFEKDLKNILKELENAKKNAALAGKARKQLLNVGCFDGVYTDDFLPQLFEYFQRNAPELKLVLHRMSFSEGTKALKGNKIDLWLTLQLGWEGAGNFCEMQLIRRKAALIFPSESRWGRQEQLSFDDFQGGTFVTVGRERGQGVYYSSLRKIQELGIVPGEVEEADNIFTALSYVKLRNGFMVLSERVADVFGGLGKLVLPERLGDDVLAVWNRDQTEIAEWMDGYCRDLQTEAGR